MVDDVYIVYFVYTATYGFLLMSNFNFRDFSTKNFIGLHFVAGIMTID